MLKAGWTEIDVEVIGEDDGQEREQDRVVVMTELTERGARVSWWGVTMQVPANLMKDWMLGKSITDLLSKGVDHLLAKSKKEMINCSALL